MRNTWTVTPETELDSRRRKETKVIEGEVVTRVRAYGLHYASIRGQSATGAYARNRWATRHFKCLGETFVTYGDLMEFLKDPEAVQAAKNKSNKVVDTVGAVA